MYPVLALFVPTQESSIGIEGNFGFNLNLQSDNSYRFGGLA